MDLLRLIFAGLLSMSLLFKLVSTCWHVLYDILVETSKQSVGGKLGNKQV